MNTSTLRLLLHTEINVLNEMIDKKIMMGKSFIKEAHRHKVLLKKMEKLSKVKSKKFQLSSLLML